jgi:hypothetical protein
MYFSFFFTYLPCCILILSNFFIHQLMHKWIVLKTILKFTLKLALQQLLHVLGAITIIREHINALPDYGDCTETCRSCFNVNFNVNFKIVFKTIHLCTSWWIKNFDNLKCILKISREISHLVQIQYLFKVFLKRLNVVEIFSLACYMSLICCVRMIFKIHLKIDNTTEMCHLIIFQNFYNVICEQDEQDEHIISFICFNYTVLYMFRTNKFIIRRLLLYTQHIATRHHIHAWKILYPGCTAVTSWWWTCLFETCRGQFLLLHRAFWNPYCSLTNKCTIY